MLFSDTPSSIELFTKKLAIVNTALRQFIQYRLKELNINLTFEMLQVLTCLWNKDGINQQEIANMTVKDKASITYLIDNLTARHLVQRIEDGADRRNNLIYLTEQGRNFRKLIQPLIAELYMVTASDINQDDIRLCMNVLERVETNLRNGR